MMGQENGNRMEDILLAITPDGNVREFRLNQMGKRQLTVGRSHDNDIVLDSSMVSHSHGQLFLKGGRAYYQDMGSSNGTYFDVLGNKRYLKNSTSQMELRDGMVLNIGGMGKENAVYLLYSVCLPTEGWQKIGIGRRRLTIGRAAGNDIVLTHPSISRNQAVVEPVEGGYELMDTSGKHSTMVNGRAIAQRVRLKECDIIQVLASQLIFMQDCIFYKTTSEGISLTVQHLGKMVGSGSKRKELLHDVNIQIESNEFVAIIGGSGAGKTTLLNAISGFDRKITGKVFCNGMDLFRNFKSLKAIIGYVPQEDIIYQNLTLRRMLEYTAKLKMPDDVTKQERDRQIDKVLDMVELKPQQNTFIRKLSGGQKKRASIAVNVI